jgi:hypothetical protein
MELGPTVTVHSSAGSWQLAAHLSAAAGWLLRCIVWYTVRWPCNPTVAIMHALDRGHPSIHTCSSSNHVVDIIPRLYCRDRHAVLRGTPMRRQAGASWSLTPNSHGGGRQDEAPTSPPVPRQLRAERLMALDGQQAILGAQTAKTDRAASAARLDEKSSCELAQRADSAQGTGPSALHG